MKYKLSFYTIITEKIPNSDIQILFSTRTAKAFNISSTYIELIEKGEFEMLPTEMLQKFIDAEILIPKDSNELEELMELAEINSQDTSNGYFQYTIMNTADCQLGCAYCGQEHLKSKMTNDTVSLTLKRIEKNIIEKNIQHLHIGWFGGEPLMGYSKMKALNQGILELQEKYKFNYSSNLVSNGLSLKTNIYKELAEEFNCKSIEITLDGTKEFHDKRRNTKKEKDTFNIIFNNILDIVSIENYPSNGCEIRIRCNVDDTNNEGVIPLIDLLAKNNLQNKVIFYTAPVYSWGNDAHLNTTKEEYAVKEIDYFLHMYEKGFPVTPIPSVRDIVCSAVTPNYELIDPWGKVYNCTEIPLVPGYEDQDYVIGDLHKDLSTIKDFEERPYTNWYNEIKEKKHGYWCSNCKILPLCGGRCPKLWKDGIPPCPSMKFNMEDRLALAYYGLERNRNGK